MKFFLILFLIHAASAFSGETVLLIYGVPCSGKSTLASGLADRLSYKVVKKTANSNKILQDYFEKNIGIRPQSYEEIYELKKCLLKNSKAAIFRKKAILQTMNEIARSGESTIFDICLYEPQIAQPLNPVLIHVYCPLHELEKREKERARKRFKTTGSRRNQRKSISTGFRKLYRPCKKDEAIDRVFRGSPILTERDKKHLNLDQKEWTYITPVVKPHVIINSSKMTVEESVALIEDHLNDSLTECKPYCPQHLQLCGTYPKSSQQEGRE